MSELGSAMDDDRFARAAEAFVAEAMARQGVPDPHEQSETQEKADAAGVPPGAQPGAQPGAPLPRPRVIAPARAVVSPRAEPRAPRAEPRASSAPASSTRRAAGRGSAHASKPARAAAKRAAAQGAAAQPGAIDEARGGVAVAADIRAEPAQARREGFTERRGSTVDAGSAPGAGAAPTHAPPILAAGEWAQSLRHESARRQRHGGSVAVISVRLEQVDGHAAAVDPHVAERYAVPLGDTLRRRARLSDQVARVAPDRFSVMLLESAETGAVAYTERIRSICEAWVRAVPGDLNLRIAWAIPLAGSPIEWAEAEAVSLVGGPPA